MARIFVRASSMVLEATWGGPTAVPITIAAWVKPQNLSTAQGIVNIGTNGSANNRFALETTNTGQVVARSRTTSSASAVSTGTLTTGQWAMIGAEFISSTSRAARINGVTDGTNATSSVPSAPNEVEIGAINAVNGADQHIADVAIWSVTLRDDEWLALARRWQPKDIRPDALVDWWQLLGNNSPEVGYKRTALTVINAPTKGDGPGLIVRRPRALWYPAAAAGGLSIPVAMYNYRRRRVA